MIHAMPSSEPDFSSGGFSDWGKYWSVYYKYVINIKIRFKNGIILRAASSEPGEDAATDL
jgi:hypothetical protein